MSTAAPALPDEVREILRQSFFIRTTMRRRHTGTPRTVETTYVWDGVSRVYLSGYPGRRDWVANLAANPDVTLHTVEGDRWYDLPARARVLRARRERVPHLLRFIERWADRGVAPRPLFRCVVWSIRLNQRLHLPWWGPFYYMRRILDRMPCVEVSITGAAVMRNGPPPRLSEPQPGRV